jgi:hypothetical protein
MKDSTLKIQYGAYRLLRALTAELDILDDRLK